jgi:hypothetical protein
LKRRSTADVDMPQNQNNFVAQKKSKNMELGSSGETFLKVDDLAKMEGNILKKG